METAASIHPLRQASSGGGAHPSADGGQRVRRPGYPVGLLIIARRDGLHVAPGIGVHGTAGLAFDILLPVVIIRMTT